MKIHRFRVKWENTEIHKIINYHHHIVPLPICFEYFLVRLSGVVLKRKYIWVNCMWQFSCFYWWFIKLVSEHLVPEVMLNMFLMLSMVSLAHTNHHCFLSSVFLLSSSLNPCRLDWLNYLWNHRKWNWESSKIYFTGLLAHHVNYFPHVFNIISIFAQMLIPFISELLY